MDILQRTNFINTEAAPGRAIQYIVVHYTASSQPGEAVKLADRFADPGMNFSADYIVDDETAVQYNPDPGSRCCRHCGEERTDSHGGSRYGICNNRNSIGVEICSTDAPFTKAADLIAFLMDTYAIDISNVIRHYDVTGALCPGIAGWNEDSGSADAWHAFLAMCRQRSALANRESGCTIRGADIVRLLEAEGISCEAQQGFPDLIFSSLALHSDDVSAGGLLFCKGSAFRAEYLQKAMERGAVGYVAGQHFDTDLPGLIVSDICAAMGLIARAFYNFPQNGLVTVGVTGTNGKTTVTHFIANIIKEATGRKPGCLSTTGAYDGLRERPLSLTTPESTVTYAFLHETKRNGGSHFVMECSSQSEKMKRLTGLRFDLGVFTNISDDHYSPCEHSSFEEYFNYKTDIVRRFRKAVINADDPHCPDVICAACSPGQVVTYSLSADSGADVYAETVRIRGLRPVFTAVTPKWKQEITVPLPGEFNISNALAACAAGYLLGISPEKIAAGIASTFVPGRMYVVDRFGYSVIVDYAHNYASIRAALETVRELYPEKKIRIVFGTSGRTGLQRRSDIVRAAAPFCERMYITTEDPYDADPDEVVREIEMNARQTGIDCRAITDRTKCVETALAEMTRDVVLFLAAKGSEDFIKAGGKRVYYESDVSIAWKMLGRKKEHAEEHAFLLPDPDLHYYWFHQTENASDYDPVHPVYGKFGLLMNNNSFPLSEAGCSVYALAIALSNVLGTCITPYDVLLNVLKASVRKQDDRWIVTFDGSRGVDTLHQPYTVTNAKLLAASAAESYPECVVTVLQDFAASQKTIDDVLRSGGCIYLCVDSCRVYTGKSSHLIVLREKKADGKYYVLSSAAFRTFGDTEQDLLRAMKEIGITWEELCAAMPMRPCIIAFQARKDCQRPAN